MQPRTTDEGASLLAVVEEYESTTRRLAQQGSSILPASLNYKPDWRRLLSGSALRAPEALAGYAIRRRLSFASMSLTLDLVPDWLRHRPQGTPVVVSGDAGEGKSTLIAQLSLTLYTTSIVLGCRDLTLPDAALLSELADIARSRLDLAEVPSIVLFHEIERKIDLEEAQLINSAASKLSNFDDRAIHVVILGRPAQLRWIQGDKISFKPLSTADGADLRQAIQACASAGLESTEAATMNSRFPNLSSFGRLSTLNQEEMLSDPGRPILAALLQASYGENLPARVSAEYEALNEHDRTAYVWVALATVAFGGTSELLLRKIAPHANLEDRCKLDPWDISGELVHRARHRVIALTMIEQITGTSRISSCIQKLMEACSDNSRLATPRDLLDVLFTAVRWTPVGASGVRLTPGQLRRIVRETVADNLALVTGLVETASVHQLVRWGQALSNLLPDKPGQSDSNAALAELSLRALEAAHEALMDDPDWSHRISYYLDKGEMQLALIYGEPLSHHEILQVVRPWADFLGEPWNGPDFYADLAQITMNSITRLVLSGDFSRDDPELLTLAVAACSAYQYLIANSKPSSAQEAQHATFLSRTAVEAFPSNRSALLRASWELSLALGTPSIPTALALDAQYRRAAGTAGSREDREKVEEERRKLLDAVRTVGAPVKYFEYYLRLLEMSSGDEVRAVIREDLDPVIEQLPDSLSRAFALQALASANDTSDQLRTARLTECVALYAALLQDPDNWQSLNHYWRVACRLLASKDVEAGQRAFNEWNRTRKRLKA